MGRNYGSYIHRDAYKSGTKRFSPGNLLAESCTTCSAKRQVPFDPSEFLKLQRNYPTISETLLAFEYLHSLFSASSPPQTPLSVIRRVGGHGTF